MVVVEMMIEGDLSTVPVFSQKVVLTGTMTMAMKVVV